MTTLQQNRCGEWAFTSQNTYGEPFNQVELTACFTHADTGAEKRVPAFWAGGREWRVRFAAHEVGTYRFRTECSEATDRGLHWPAGWCFIGGWIYEAALPVLNAAALKLRQVTDKRWLKPWLLLETKAADGTRVRLCDLASAGMAGTAYETWLPVKDAPPPVPFARNNPLRSQRIIGVGPR